MSSSPPENDLVCIAEVRVEESENVSHIGMISAMCWQWAHMGRAMQRSLKEVYQLRHPQGRTDPLTVDMLQSAYAGIKRVAEAQTDATDHIASHNAPQKKKVYRSTGCHFGGRVAVLVANNSNELYQEYLHTTTASHATSGHASSATPHVSPQTLQDIASPVPHDSLVYPSLHRSHNTESPMSRSNSLVFTTNR